MYHEGDNLTEHSADGTIDHSGGNKAIPIGRIYKDLVTSCIGVCNENF